MPTVGPPGSPYSNRVYKTRLRFRPPSSSPGPGCSHPHVLSTRAASPGECGCQTARPLGRPGSQGCPGWLARPRDSHAEQKHPFHSLHLDGSQKRNLTTGSFLLPSRTARAYCMKFHRKTSGPSDLLPAQAGRLFMASFGLSARARARWCFTSMRTDPGGEVRPGQRPQHGHEQGRLFRSAERLLQPVLLISHPPWDLGHHTRISFYGGESRSLQPAILCLPWSCTPARSRIQIVSSLPLWWILPT